jgi:predicted nucleic acid-binding Zn ribbon protein
MRRPSGRCESRQAGLVTEGAPSGRRERGPRPLAHAVEELRHSLAPPTLLAKVQECWDRAVGPSISGEAAPTSERDGIVTVSCSSAVWSAELEMLSSALVEQLNEALPAGVQMRGLKFVTRPR